MSILGLIAAFGGGVFAAAIGAVPAFIMTGIFSSSSPAVSFAFFIIFFLVILFPDEKIYAYSTKSSISMFSFSANGFSRFMTAHNGSLSIITCDSKSFGIGAYIKATSAKPSLNK